MYYRILFYFITLLIALIFLPVCNVSAQPGYFDTTKYLVRDETGKVMSLKEMEKLAVSINGVPLKLRYDIFNKEPAFYEYEFVQYFDNKIIRDTGKIPFTNPLPTSIQPYNAYGRIGDLTLIYRGKQMRLIFDINEARHSTIDSLPFQSGTFHLNRAMTLDCNAGNPCVVSSANWDDTSKDRVRHPVWNNFWINAFDPRHNRCDKTITVINNQKDWTTTWELFERERKASQIIGIITDGQLLPAIDFRTEMVLVIYLQNISKRPGDDSLIVDKNGDLTFQPPPPVKAWHSKFCSILLLEIYRSGVKSIEGKPLPPAALQD